MIARSSHYQAYRQATQTVAKTRQIVMLYDGMIRFMQQAQSAMQEKRIEDRYNLLTKTTAIIAGLQSSLDFEAGKDVAQMLYDFYSLLESRITSLHQSNDVVLCSQLIDEIKEMRNVWDAIDRQSGDKASAGQAEASGQPMALAENDSAPATSALPLNGLTFSA